MDYELQDAADIPKPALGVKLRSRPRKYPFHEMQVGQMFFVPGAKPSTMMSLAYATGKRLGFVIKTRRLWMVHDRKEWVQVAEGTPDAKLGVAIYRDA